MKYLSFIVALIFPFLSKAQGLNTDLRDSTLATLKSSIKVHGQNPPKVQSFIVPAVLIGYGLVSLGDNAIRQLDYHTQSTIHDNHPSFKTRIDDYSRFAPALAVYALNLSGIKGKHNLADATALYVLSTGIMVSSTYIVKGWAGRTRPDGVDNSSFPSGHTANAFATAEFLNQEYRDVSPWIGYAGYTVATATGVLRLYNNKHWLSDVVAGAGFGIASTKIAYLVYPHLKKLVLGKQSVSYSMVPLYQQKTVGLSFNGTF